METKVVLNSNSAGNFSLDIYACSRFHAGSSLKWVNANRGEKRTVLNRTLQLNINAGSPCSM
jgi:hypothetical protein